MFVFVNIKGPSHFNEFSKISSNLINFINEMDFSQFINYQKDYEFELLRLLNENKFSILTSMVLTSFLKNLTLYIISLIIPRHFKLNTIGKYSKTNNFILSFKKNKRVNLVCLIWIRCKKESPRGRKGMQIMYVESLESRKGICVGK